MNNIPAHLLTPRDWQAEAVAHAARECGTPEGRRALAEATRYGALADRLADLQAESSAWRELSRRLYIELYWCDRQVRETARRGMPILSNGKTVRDVLADAKAALERSPATVAAPEQDFDAEHAQRLALQHHAADQAQRVADLEALVAELLALDVRGCTLGERLQFSDAGRDLLARAGAVKREGGAA